MLSGIERFFRTASVGPSLLPAVGHAVICRSSIRRTLVEYIMDVSDSQTETTRGPLGVGARVTLRGLVSRPELNGAAGRVLKLDKKTGRYGVRLADGGLMAVKPSNLEPMAFEARVPDRVQYLLDISDDALTHLLGAWRRRPLG